MELEDLVMADRSWWKYDDIISEDRCYDWERCNRARNREL